MINYIIHFIFLLVITSGILVSGKPLRRIYDQSSTPKTENVVQKLKNYEEEINDLKGYVTVLYSMENDTSIDRPSTESTITEKKRKRRYAYEDTAEWDYDLEEFDYEGESEDAMIKYVTMHWKAVATKVFFGFVLLCFGGFCCYTWCQGFCTAVKVGICYLCGETCIGKCCRKCGCIREDKGYQRMKALFAMMGMTLDYDTYNQIRDTISETCKGFGQNLDDIPILQR